MLQDYRYEQQTRTIKVIIFDLDGVLIRTSRGKSGMHLLWHHGSALISQVLHGTNPQHELFTWMNCITDNDTISEHTICSPDEKPLLMHNWLAGVPGYDSNTILHTLHSYLDSCSCSHSYRNMLLGIAEAIFDPHTRSKHTGILRSGYRLLKRLQRQYPECTFAVLSNYDTECFEHIYTQPHLQPIFKQFDPHDIHISAYIRMIKPESSIYYYICDTYGIAPDECCFIDDRMINVEAARDVGMHAVCFGTDDMSYIDDVISKDEPNHR